MPIPVGFAECWMRWEIVGDPEGMYTHFGFKVAAGPFTQANADAMLDHTNTIWGPASSSAYSLAGGHVLVGTEEGALRYDRRTLTAGTAPLQALPANCTYLIQLKTGLAGRRNRGRMYPPAVPESDVDSLGKLSTAVGSRLDTVRVKLETLAAGGIANTNIQGFYILHSNELIPPTLVTAVIPIGSVATQRRRLSR